MVKAATSEADALKKFKLNKESFQWPVVSFLDSDGDYGGVEANGVIDC